MNQELFEQSKDMANFFYSAYNFYNDLSLLLKAIADELSQQGCKIGDEQYYLPFYSTNTDGRTGFSITKEFWGRFYNKRLENQEQFQQEIHFIYGIVFDESVKPESQIKPWVPYIHFMKTKLKSPDKWEGWNWNRRIIDFKEIVDDSKQFEYVSYIKPSSANSLSDLEARIDEIYLLRLPLTSIKSTDDIRKIILPIVNALSEENEIHLQQIHDYTEKKSAIIW